MRGNTVAAAKVVLGHVAPTPWEAPEAEKALAGKTNRAARPAVSGNRLY